MHRGVLLAAASAILALVALSPAPARLADATGPGEVIRSFEAEVEIRRDGSLQVFETIEYDFGSNSRHGIFRDIPVRYRHDDRYDRILRLDGFEVAAEPPGTSARFQIEKADAATRIKIGDPDRTITGLHRYRIAYRVRGVLNRFEQYDELNWNAVGTGWDVPMARVTARVRAPAGILRAACYSGPEGSRRPCASLASEGPEVTAGERDVSSRSGLTVVVAIPAGVVPEPRPILDERWSARRAFALTPATGLASGALLALVLGAMVRLLWIHGRDRRFAGSPVDVVFGSVDGTEERVPLGERPITPVKYEPPGGIKAGEVGTLVDECAHPLDVTATIVDLAVRGFLRIEEIPKKGWFGRTDWRLVRLPKEQAGLKRYEAELLGALFREGTEVELSDLKTKFSERLKAVQDALYDEVVQQGWFRARPDRIRLRWCLLGIGILVVGVALTVALAAWTHAGLVGVPVVLGGLALAALAGRMPHRTAGGTAVMRRVQGFRRLIEGPEAEQARFSERANIFSEYLPYAIVFGCTEKWARAFRGLDQEVSASGWYSSPHGFTADGFGERIDDFSTTTAGTIVASAPSSSGFSGGSSGGGFGGGGGGSW